MKLFLAVPQQAKRPPSGTATRPAQMRAWIARLPLINTTESLRQLHGALYGLNRTELRVNQRLRLLDTCRPPLRSIRARVETQLAGGAIPLSDHDLATAELFRDCCVEMAYGYKAVVLQIARATKRRRLAEMCLGMGRALFYLEQTIFACALYRQMPPEGVWQEVHAIYQYARSLGVSEVPLRDPIARTRSTGNISLIYRRVLLFGLSDPFHQSIPLMGRVLEFLRRNAHNAQLRTYSRPPTERCQFVIDPQSDYAARAYVKQKEQQPPKGALLLDTVNLTRRAHEQIKRLVSAAEIDVELDSEFQDDLGRKLLEEVVYAWGLIPRRENERHDAGQDHVEIMVGMAAASYCLNGEKALSLSSTDHAGDHATVAASRLHQIHRRRSRSEKLDCRVLDRAESGLRLAATYSTTDTGTFRVGDIIVSRYSGGAWTPGLIRWMRCVEDEVQLGIRSLQSGIRPVAVKPVATEREVPFKEALALWSNDGVSLQLITPAGLCHNQSNLIVDDGEILLMTRSRRLIERTQMVEWLECETLDP